MFKVLFFENGYVQSFTEVLFIGGNSVSPPSKKYINDFAPIIVNFKSPFSPTSENQNVLGRSEFSPQPAIPSLDRLRIQSMALNWCRDRATV